MNSSNRTFFGQTDLQVSRLCQGTAFRHLPRADSPQSLAVLHHCLDQGINFFDTAQAYGWGGAEEVLGRAIAGRRDEVVICTKVPSSLAPTSDGDPGERVRYTRAHLTDRLEESLRRLRTDYVDLYLLHHRDEGTSPEAIAEVMEDLVQAGKTRYWGVSNHSATEVEAFLDLAPIAGVEDYYNIAGSHCDETGRSRVEIYEEEMLPLLRRTGLGCLAFSPMDTGLLARPNDPALSSLVAAIDQVAADLGTSRAAVCVAWVLHQGITCVLAGAESAAHVDANLRGTCLQLPSGRPRRPRPSATDLSRQPTGATPVNIVDAHIHVWTSDFDQYPLAPGFTPADLWLPSFTPDDHFAYSRKVGKVCLNLVQMTWYGLDHSYILDLIASDPETYTGTGIVPGVSDVSLADPGKTMLALAEGGIRAFRVRGGSTGRPTAFGRSGPLARLPRLRIDVPHRSRAQSGPQLPHGPRRPARLDPPLPPLPRNPRNPRPYLRSAHPRRRLARRRYPHPMQHGPLPARHGQARPVPSPRQRRGSLPRSPAPHRAHRRCLWPRTHYVGKRQRRPRPHEKSHNRLRRSNRPDPRPRRFPQPKRQGIHPR